MIEPVSDALTTSISPACKAKKAMISSAMLPNVALRIPPTCGPVSEPRRSVESPTTHASPRIASADAMKRTVSDRVEPEVERDRHDADREGGEDGDACGLRQLSEDRRA